MYSTTPSPMATGHSPSRQRGGGGGAVPAGLSPGGGEFSCLLIGFFSRPGSGPCGSGLGWLSRGEAPHERQSRAGDVTPAIVDGQRVPAAGDLDDLGHVLV